MRLATALPDPPPAPEASRREDLSAQADRWTSGVASLDAALAGGLAHGQVHEFYAAEAADAAAAAGFVAALATGMSAGDTDAAARNVLWLRARRAVKAGGALQASGWADLGGAPGRALLGLAPDTMALLRAATDALRCPGLGAVIVEDWGAMRELDLTASRRLVLAAERSGVPLLLLRIDAAPTPSAARTRWQVGAAPSRALPGNAPGLPTFDIALLRQRSGPSGLDWRLEWDRDQRKFRESPLSVPALSIPADRPASPRAGSGRGSGGTLRAA